MYVCMYVSVTVSGKEAHDYTPTMEAIRWIDYSLKIQKLVAAYILTKVNQSIYT